MNRDAWRPAKIRMMAETDLEIILSWRNHVDIRAFMYTQHEISINEHVRWYERVKSDPDRYLLIYEEDDFPVGFVNFTVSSGTSDSNWGFYVKPGSAKGVGYRMGNAALKYGFDIARFHKITGESLIFNQKSIQFHLSLGFQSEGIFQHHFPEMEKSFDVYRFSISSNEWRHNLLPL